MAGFNSIQFNSYIPKNGTRAVEADGTEDERQTGILPDPIPLEEEEEGSQRAIRGGLGTFCSGGNRGFRPNRGEKQRIPINQDGGLTLCQAKRLGYPR